MVYYTRKAVCEILGISPRTLARLVKRGEIIGEKFGKYQQSPRLFSPDEIEQYILRKYK